MHSKLVQPIVKIGQDQLMPILEYSNTVQQLIIYCLSAIHYQQTDEIPPYELKREDNGVILSEVRTLEQLNIQTRTVLILQSTTRSTQVQIHLSVEQINDQLNLLELQKKILENIKTDGLTNLQLRNSPQEYPLDIQTQLQGLINEGQINLFCKMPFSQLVELNQQIQQGQQTEVVNAPSTCLSLNLQESSMKYCSPHNLANRVIDLTQQSQFHTNQDHLEVIEQGNIQEPNQSSSLSGPGYRPIVSYSQKIESSVNQSSQDQSGSEEQFHNAPTQLPQVSQQQQLTQQQDQQNKGNQKHIDCLLIHKLRCSNPGESTVGNIKTYLVHSLQQKIQFTTYEEPRTDVDPQSSISQIAGNQTTLKLYWKQKYPKSQFPPQKDLDQFIKNKDN